MGPTLELSCGLRVLEDTQEEVGYSPSFIARERKKEAWATKTQPEAGVGENFSSGERPSLNPLEV